MKRCMGSQEGKCTLPGHIDCLFDSDRWALADLTAYILCLSGTTGGLNLTWIAQPQKMDGLILKG